MNSKPNNYSNGIPVEMQKVIHPEYQEIENMYVFKKQPFILIPLAQSFVKCGENLHDSVVELPMQYISNGTVINTSDSIKHYGLVHNPKKNTIQSIIKHMTFYNVIVNINLTTSNGNMDDAEITLILCTVNGEDWPKLITTLIVPAENSSLNATLSLNGSISLRQCETMHLLLKYPNGVSIISGQIFMQPHD